MRARALAEAPTTEDTVWDGLKYIGSGVFIAIPGIILHRRAEATALKVFAFFLGWVAFIGFAAGIITIAKSLKASLAYKPVKGLDKKD